MNSKKRDSGILLHVTSLPSKHGVGTLGKEAIHFIDWMKNAGLKIWQVLPLVPTSYGDSPYQSVCSTALNYYMIDFDILAKKGLLKKDEYKDFGTDLNPRKVDYRFLFEKKIPMLRLAFSRFDVLRKDFSRFEGVGTYKDFAIFMTIKSHHEHTAWELWPNEYREYTKEIEEEVLTTFRSEYLFWIWTQYEFISEWKSLHAYARQNGISIMGDMPLYVAYDSVEVWKHPELFILNEDKSRKLVAGCPPDAFTDDGQLWGNPVYDWEYMKETDYSWWNHRINSAFEFFDILRIDHFRGFDRFYAIPAEHNNARNGEWLEGPHSDLFKDKKNYQIVAEDLGIIDEGVRTLMRETGYPGMKILEFAFDGSPDNEHKPSNYTSNYVVYTGTHDNMPLYQYILDLSKDQRKIYYTDLKKEGKVLGVDVLSQSAKQLTRASVEIAMASTANCCIIPMQDFLAKGEESRMNLPSTVSTKNWSYRVLKKELSAKLAEEIKTYILKYRRK